MTADRDERSEPMPETGGVRSAGAGETLSADAAHSAGAGEVRIAGTVETYSFAVLGGRSCGHSRSVGLFLTPGAGFPAPAQVLLRFSEAGGAGLIEASEGFVSLHLPVSELRDILHLLENWRTRKIEVAYDAGTGELRHFQLFTPNGA